MQGNRLSPRLPTVPPRAGGIHHGWAVGLLLAGCVSAPGENFYTLSPPVTMAAPAGAAPGLRVVVAVTGVPESVDRPQLALRTGDHGVRVLEQQRWAESLEQGVARALADQLSAALPGIVAVPGAPPSPLVPKMLIRVRVLRFDAWAGPGAGVDDELEWRLSCAQGQGGGLDGIREVPADQGQGRYRVAAGEGIATDTAGALALVRAHADALAQAAHQLAPQVEALAHQCP